AGAPGRDCAGRRDLRGRDRSLGAGAPRGGSAPGDLAGPAACGGRARCRALRRGGQRPGPAAVRVLGVLRRGPGRADARAGTGVIRGPRTQLPARRRGRRCPRLARAGRRRAGAADPAAAPRRPVPAKGKLDKGETAPAAAVREVVEETGYRVRLRRPLPPSAYLLPDGRTKVVHYWAATVRAKVARGPQSRREVDDVHWVPLEEAMQRVTRQSDQVPVEALRRHLEADELETAPIVIQRHGAALSRSKWRKGEDTRPLNKKGSKQARALPPLLDAF